MVLHWSLTTTFASIPKCVGLSLYREHPVGVGVGVGWGGGGGESSRTGGVDECMSTRNAGRRWRKNSLYNCSYQ